MEENKNKTSFLKEIENVKNKLTAEKADFRPHVLVMFEVDEQGLPVGYMTSVAGGPVMVLGMAELIISKLDGLREVVHEKVHAVESASNKLNEGLTAEVKQKLQDLEMRARKAMQEDNIEEAENIAKEVTEILKNLMGDASGLKFKFNDETSDDEKPKSDFDLNDFKDM